MPGFYAMIQNGTYGGWPEGQEIYSPITMNQQWSKVIRFLFIFVFGTFSVHMTLFFVTSFYIEESLRRGDNVFLASAGICDFMIALIVFPSAAIASLFGHLDTLKLCILLNFVVKCSTYGFSLSFFMIAIETLLRTCRCTRLYEILVATRMWLICIFIFIFSGATAAVGIIYKLDSDYCERSFEGNYVFRYTTLYLCHILPCSIGLLALIVSSNRIQKRYNCDNTYKTSTQYVRDSVMTNTNITILISYMSFWTHFVLNSYFYENVTDSQYYYSLFLALGRIVLTSPMHVTSGTNFRSAYRSIMRVCCCQRDGRSARFEWRYENVARENTFGLHEVRPPQQPRNRVAEILETVL